MLATATILYLPDHVVTVSKRTYYYFAGETTIETVLGDTASKASEAMLGAATAAYHATVHTAAAAQEAAAEAMGWA